MTSSQLSNIPEPQYTLQFTDEPEVNKNLQRWRQIKKMLLKVLLPAVLFSSGIWNVVFLAGQIYNYLTMERFRPMDEFCRASHIYMIGLTISSILCLMCVISCMWTYYAKSKQLDVFSVFVLVYNVIWLIYSGIQVALHNIPCLRFTKERYHLSVGGMLISIALLLASVLLGRRRNILKFQESEDSRRVSQLASMQRYADQLRQHQHITKMKSTDGDLYVSDTLDLPKSKRPKDAESILTKSSDVIDYYNYPDTGSMPRLTNADVGYHGESSHHDYSYSYDGQMRVHNVYQ